MFAVDSGTLAYKEGRKLKSSRPGTRTKETSQPVITPPLEGLSVASQKAKLVSALLNRLPTEIRCKVRSGCISERILTSEEIDHVCVCWTQCPRGAA